MIKTVQKAPTAIERKRRKRRSKLQKRNSVQAALASRGTWVGTDDEVDRLLKDVADLRHTSLLRKANS